MEVLAANNKFYVKLAQTANFKIHLEAVKSIPGRYYDKATNLWVVPGNVYQDSDHLALVLKNTVQRLSMVQNKTAKTEPLPDLLIDIPLKREMYPFQKLGTAYCLKHKRVLIGDQQGLGKTIQAIAAVEGVGKFPGLIITKSSLKRNWEKEINDWTHRKVLIFSDSVKSTWPHLFENGWFEIGIVNYESLQKYFVKSIDRLEPKERFRLHHIHFWEWIKIFKFIIVDESHYVKDSGTKRTKFVAGISQGKEQVYLLSGTPALNDPEELYTQLCILGQNQHFGKLAFYKATFCGKKNRGNLKVLNTLLTRHCYYRRLKSEVLKDLPAKTRQVILCDIDNRAEYEKAENDFRKYLESLMQKTNGEIDRAMRAEALVKMMELKKIAAKGKLTAVKEWVESLHEQGEKVVVFGYHKEINHTIIKTFPGAVAILSQTDTPADVIQANKEAFQKDPATKLIVCSISAAAEGHTLTAASNLGMVELPWHFGKAEQCEDRIHRIGQQWAVTITYFLADKTIDRDIYNLVMDKKAMHDSITGTDEDVPVNTIDRMINLFTSKK